MTAYRYDSKNWSLNDIKEEFGSCMSDNQEMFVTEDKITRFKFDFP